jgi:hypothetical protein
MPRIDGFHLAVAPGQTHRHEEMASPQE